MYATLLKIFDDHYIIILTAIAVIGFLIVKIIILRHSILRRRRIEGLLRKSKAGNLELNRQLQTLLDGIPDHLMLIGPDRRLISVNRAGQEFIDINKDSPESRSSCCHVQWSRREDPCTICPVQTCFSTGEAQELIMPAGTRIFGIKTFPLKNEQGEVYNVIKLATDITEKLQLREETERNGRLSFVGEISTGIAHEINNPNGLILGNLAVIDEAFADALPILDEHYRTHGDFFFGGMFYSRMKAKFPLLIEESSEGARRIRQIVGDLKDFTRGGSELQINEECDLNAIVQQASRLTARLIQQKTEKFQLHLSSSRPMLRGNRRRLEQVFINLLSNACQALQNRGKGLSISTDYAAGTNECFIVVRDEGIGIAPESLPLIFTPFFTTRREEGGTGLGLSVSQRIVTEHGGRMSFISTPGFGTTATVTLPCNKEQSIQ